ncbi:hypothetical protein [Acetobacter sp.]|jgi:hypothetical protein|uniref:hypothetical protein n=1 Tax=Acetobacter sp. TaxID=440 RepID=UPI0025B90841|nr:hypothetical protein [Acetobacter sp.]MCH4089860.1 hypothetical protein [Acetobacter sp.]MCI1298556.1 hypothetical protein [Acetobacter sp.]MCI1315121.1 hypothetical protein [Acetobacter sp.]
MIRIILIIAAPLLLIGLCGVAAAQTEEQPVRTLFTSRPLNEGEASHGTDVASMIQTPEADEASTTEVGMEVTSDSRDYCSRLMRTIDQYNVQSHPENDVTALRKEGQRLCSQGYVRLGVTRLREALAILKGRNSRQ